MRLQDMFRKNVVPIEFRCVFIDGNGTLYAETIEAESRTVAMGEALERAEVCEAVLVGVELQDKPKRTRKEA